MKTHIFLCLLVFPVLFASCHQRPADNVPMEAPGTPAIASTLSNQQVNAFAEDSKGYIWIGTFRGLNRYDGHDYYQYFCTNDSTGLPDNQILDLLNDSQGRLWVATNDGLCLYTEQDGFERIPQPEGDRHCRQLLEDREGDIYVNTGAQILRFDPTSRQLVCAIPGINPTSSYYTKSYIDGENHLWVITPESLQRYSLVTRRVTDSIPLAGKPYISSLHPNGDLWMVGENGITVFDTNSARFRTAPRAMTGNSRLHYAEIMCIYPYTNNQLLLATFKDGIFCYDSTRGTLTHQTDAGFPFEMPVFGVMRMFTDSNGNLWMGSASRGYAVHYRQKEWFNNNSYLYTYMKDKFVTSLAVERDRYLWAATQTDGLYRYDMQGKRMEQINTGNIFQGRNWQLATVQTLLVDRRGSIWLLPRGCRMIARCRYDAGKLRVEGKYKLDYLPMNIAEGTDGKIWVSTFSPYVYSLAPDGKDFDVVKVFKDGFVFAPGLQPCRNGHLVAAAYGQPLQEVIPETGTVREVLISEADRKTCIRRSTFIPTVIRRDSKRRLWIGTVGNGLLCYTPDDGRLCPVPGAPCTDISSIEEDAQGNLWVGTLYGLGKYDPETGTFTNYYEADGIGGNQFYDRASCRLPDGTLVFGGTHGLTFFNPADVQVKHDVRLLFEDLKVHNRRIRPGTGCMDKHLSCNPDVHLRHDQNSFGISFAALNYSEYGRAHYYYCMEGFDSYWIDARNNREAYYANLPAGEYDFKVKVVNDQNETEAENSLHITVQPAPWATWWAYTLYILLIAAIAGLFVKNYLRIRAEKAALRLAEQEKEQEKLVNRMNMSFFANVSHEFRTPLTMIAGPVAQLCDSPEIGGRPKELLHIVQRSVNRMLKLVNQLLDFNKLENDALKLKVRRQDVVTVLKAQIDMYRESAARRGIGLETDGLEDAFLMWLDEDKLDKIFGNLMSNALKFTPQGGRITVSFDVVGRTEAAKLFPLDGQDKGVQYIKVSVADTGKGIPEDQLEKVFERYYQLDGHAGGSYNWGTGIGLYYARRLARLHHGYLKAFPPAKGCGAVFTFILPADDVAYAGEERRAEELPQSEAFPLPEQERDSAIHSEEEVNDKERRQTILVVDDDAEVVHYLEVLLSKDYRVVCRFDADAALEAIRKEVPDLVLSDVVMPEKSGCQLCCEVKEDLQLCHIPVVLVTAKNATKDQVEGLNAGADAYVTKPFDPVYLQALIKSQLSNREKVRNLLAHSTETDNIGKDMLSPQDEAFMSELYRIMGEELSNTELDTVRLAESLKISRSKFYYKVKGLTGENPGSFFRTYKLNRAAQLISEGRYTLSEIADMTGFSTPSHFTRCFKKQFGVVPSEYKPQVQAPSVE